MKKTPVISLQLAIVTALFFACGKKPEPLFTVMDIRNTGVTFENKIDLTDTFNILDYLYYYNGGGVAIGDLDADGLDDVYFSSNRGSNKLYRNKGNLQFEDVTETAGVQGTGNWKTGVAMADVNGDGLLDIYVCAVGGYKSLHGRNQLFINKGGMRFSEEAHAYGLDVEGFSTQASFFDYDQDGDLDMFLVNHSVHSVESYGDSSMRSRHNEAAGDKLFRNKGPGGRQPRFTEVSADAGIYSSALGYGLNVLTTDFTGDGWDDIYVSNDFHEHDYFYINQRNGTFRESSRAAFGHQSRFSMGSDAADINGDGYPDLITLDMLPADEKTLKSSAGDDPLDIYEYKTARGYHHQYARNCLQLNGGKGTYFRDIALFAGVSATDWSWSPLLSDFNNDGVRDLFVSNGIPKRPNDLDFIKYVSSGAVESALQKGKEADAGSIAQMPGGEVPNAMFEGGSSLRFVNRSKEWGFSKPSVSNGAAYSDLDGDGDLDLVTNNMNAPATIYRNNAIQQTGNHYLHVQLKGTGANTKALGAKVCIWQKGRKQWASVMPVRGFQSASSTALHFGLGKVNTIDSMLVSWPDGSLQVLNNITGDKTLYLAQDTAAHPATRFFNEEVNKQALFAPGAPGDLPSWQHQENPYFDFNDQQLIPHQLSTQGPAFAVADVNRDGLQDVFVGGGPDQTATLLLQLPGGNWKTASQEAWAQDSAAEDVAAIFFDADGDRDADLYVASGGNELPDTAGLLRDRLYFNNGNGHFSKGILPMLAGGNRSVVCAADVDRDGDADLFIGSRVVSGHYGVSPVSHLLLNDGSGHFTIAPEQMAPGLQTAGMITGAAFTDIDRDGWTDLVLVGEWMPVTIFKNQKGVLRNQTVAYGLSQTKGLWQTLAAEDLDGDGWPELLAGNYGLNAKLQASRAFPLVLYTGDMDGNGAPDHIEALAKEGRYYPFLGKEELERAMPGLIRKQFLGYAEMAGKTVSDIFGPQLNDMNKHQAETLASLLISNQKGQLSIKALPAPMQWAPIFSFAVADLNGDGKKDILSAGNFSGVLPFEGRYDAGGVNILLQQKGWQALSPSETGLQTFDELRSIKIVPTSAKGLQLLTASNNGPMQAFRLRQ